MRKRSKCAFLATAMAATTILAAGCGNSASGGQNTADSAERVPIRWLTTGDAAAEAIQDNDRIIEAINEKLGIDLTVEIVPEANTEKVNVAMASGDFPDVVRFPQTFDELLDKAVMDDVSFRRLDEALLLPDIVEDMVTPAAKFQCVFRQPEEWQQDIFLLFRPWREGQDQGRDIRRAG